MSEKDRFMKRSPCPMFIAIRTRNPTRTLQVEAWNDDDVRKLLAVLVDWPALKNVLVTFRIRNFQISLRGQVSYP